MKKFKLSPIIIALSCITVYAGLITPMAYREGRRVVIAWAYEQPDAPAYTAQERDELSSLIDKLPNGKGLK